MQYRRKRGGSSRKRATDKMASPARSIEGSLHRAVGEPGGEEPTDPGWRYSPMRPTKKKSTRKLVKLGESGSHDVVKREPVDGPRTDPAPPPVHDDEN